MREKILFAWSGGKDSALGLCELLQNQHFEISALLTTVTTGYDRISMHGVRRTLLERQAESLGLPVEVILLPQRCSDEEYARTMRNVLQRYRGLGISAVAFGDIHLREVRDYRENHLAEAGMRGVFPLWGKDTVLLTECFVHKGFKAIVTCVDTRRLKRSLVGSILDDDFFADLPSGIDPCGENGEYHSFVFDAPMFQRPISYETGEVVVRDSFCFCDVLPTV